MKKLILTILLSMGLVSGLQIAAPSSDTSFNQTGSIVHVSDYSYAYTIYPNDYHGDQNWHRWHHGWGWWGWHHHHPWRYWHYW